MRQSESRGYNCEHNPHSLPASGEVEGSREETREPKGVKYNGKAQIRARGQGESAGRGCV